MLRLGTAADPLRIYIAAKFNAKSRLKRIRDYLNQQEGLLVSSSWMDNNVSDIPKIEVVPSEYHVVEATRDYKEITQSDLLVVDTYDESTTGGREVEIGVALALQIPIWLVGPKRNVFHYILTEEFCDWTKAMDALIQHTQPKDVLMVKAERE